MSLLSDFYIAKPEDAARYDTDQNLSDDEHAAFNGLTYDEMANLWAILQNTEATSEHADAFEAVLVVDGGQRLINGFPPEFIQTGEFAYMSCEVSDVLPIIEALSRLARAAGQSGKSLYLWMCV